MLVVMLCLVMNRHYQFYYFVPLVSFWFVVIYVTMAVWPQASEKIAEGEWVWHGIFVVFVGCFTKVP